MDKSNKNDRRRLGRRNISYYLPILDNKSHQVIGHLVDISPVGLLMDSKIPIHINVDYDLHLDFLEAIAGRASLDFIARSKWCHSDSIHPFLYNAGFEITNIDPQDIEVIKLVAQKYGVG